MQLKIDQQNIPSFLLEEKILEFKVTPDKYFSFQRVSEDFNPLHTDSEFAKSKGFEGKVMYGNILNAFISYFVGMSLPSRDVIIQCQDISFHKPVYLNDTIILKAQKDTYSEATRSIIYKLRFERKDGREKNTLIAKGHVQIGLI